MYEFCKFIENKKLHTKFTAPVSWIPIINKLRDVKFLCLLLVPDAYGSIRDFIYNHIS